MTNLPSNWHSPGGEPAVIKEILYKFLSTGARVSIALVRSNGEYKSVLYLDGRRVNGPPAPQPLEPPKGDLTHWMGNKPTIGLTEAEAGTILWEIQEWTQRTAADQ
jgi:hypothetical protein